MTTIKSAKSKGNQFEYDCQASLKQIYLDIYRTSERGFQQQYDLRSDLYKVVFECKRLKGISWNQLVKFYEKLNNRIEDDYDAFLLFKSNNQPCLVFFKEEKDSPYFLIKSFEEVFESKFIKHESTRGKKNE